MTLDANGQPEQGNGAAAGNGNGDGPSFLDLANEHLNQGQPAGSDDGGGEVAGAVGESDGGNVPPVAVADEVTQDPGSTGSTSPLVSALRTGGFEVPDDFNDHDLIAELEHSARMRELIPSDDVLRQLQQQAEHGRTYLAHASEFEAWRQSRAQDDGDGRSPSAQRSQQTTQAQPDSASDPVKTRPKWETPEWNTEWDRLLERDEGTGRLVPIKSLSHIPGLAEEAAKANQVLQRRNEIAQRLASDPLGVVREAGLDDELNNLKASIREDILNEIKETQATAAAESETERYFREHNDELIQVNANGEAVHDALGNLQMTEKGQAYLRLFDEAAEFGISDEQAQHRYARTQAERQFASGGNGQEQQHRTAASVASAASQQSNQQPAAQTAQQPQHSSQSVATSEQRNVGNKNRFLRRARSNTRGVNRTGTIESAEASGNPQNDGSSFLGLAMQELRNQGLVPDTG